MYFVLLLSHLLSDFIFQTNKMVKRKSENIIKGNLFHSYIIFILGFFTLFIFKSSIPYYELIYISFMLTLVHFFIDISKVLVLRKFMNIENNVYIFIADQLIHLLTITVFYLLYCNKYYIEVEYQIIALTLCIVISVVFVGDYIIRYTILKFIENARNNGEEVAKRRVDGVSSMIGKVERSIMLLLLFFNMEIGVVTIIGIKSLIRYKEKKEYNNDYYILGTMMSVLMVILGYFIWYLTIRYYILNEPLNLSEIFNFMIN